MKRCGTTLIEIMAALLIMAFAFIPIIGVIGSGAKATDISGSYIFGKTMARNILNTILDDVPFEAIGVSGSDVADTDGSSPEAHVGLLADVVDPAYQVASFLALIGNTTDNFARGKILDDRGFEYNVKVFVFPVPGNSSPSVATATDMTFRYCPRPKFETEANNPDWYTAGPYVKMTAQTPYQMTTPDVVVKGAKALGASSGPAGDYCVMKKILLKIKWKIKSGPERSIEVFTAKANLDKKS